MHARTSQSHPLQIDTLGPVGRGRLGLTFCPGKFDPHAQTGAWDRDLDTDLRTLRDWGASTVVTLMETDELELLRVPDFRNRKEPENGHNDSRLECLFAGQDRLAQPAAAPR